MPIYEEDEEDPSIYESCFLSKEAISISRRKNEPTA